MNRQSDELDVWYRGSLGEGLQSLRTKIKSGKKRPLKWGAKKGQKIFFHQFQPNFAKSIP